MNDIKNIRICGIMKTTLLDYPGKLACTVFLPGCNMRCPFCHNPRVVFGKDELVDINELFSFLKKRQGVLDGVCITGGEPTLYGDSLVALIKEIKDLGFLVKLDTNGTSPEMIKKLTSEKLVDYIAMDIKSDLTAEAYSKACGTPIDIDLIKQSIDLIANSGVDHEFRTTVVRELHTENNLLNAAKFLSGKGRYFLQSFVDSGDLLDKTHTFSAIDKSEMERIAGLASAYTETYVRGV